MYRILELNPQLTPYAHEIDRRMELYRTVRQRLLKDARSLCDFANAHHYYGFHHGDGGWYYREWAPNATALYLEGDFNGWNRTSHPLTSVGNGSWEIFLCGDDALWEGCRVKVIVHSGWCPDGMERIPLFARRTEQDPHTHMFCAAVTDDQNVFPWTDGDFAGQEELYIYEAHIGMAQEEGRVGTYREFTENILPRIKKAGYNTVQLMAVMEHPYYGSFGYQVSNFYSPSGWFGEPDDLPRLINRAHELGLRVLLDVVHSHAVKNTLEGIFMFDGTVW